MEPVGRPDGVVKTTQSILGWCPQPLHITMSVAGLNQKIFIHWIVFFRTTVYLSCSYLCSTPVKGDVKRSQSGSDQEETTFNNPV